MSNFLSQLLSRSSGHAMVAKPRLASRFEPESPEASPVRGFSLDTTRFEELPEVQLIGKQAEPNAPDKESRKPGAKSRGSRIVPKPVPTHEQNEVGSLDRDDKAPINETTETAAIQEGTSLIPSDEAHFLDNSLRPTLRDNRFERNDPTLSSSPRVPVKTTPHIESQQETKTATKALSSTEENFFEETLPAKDFFSAPHLAKESVAKPGTSSQDASPLSTQRLMPLRPKTWEPQVAQTTPSSVIPDPEIHITIGRVEVRAIVAEKPKQTPKAEPPVMGLHEYLRKQRSGATK